MANEIGVGLKEIDYSNSTTTASSSGAGFAGSFNWGPVMQPNTVSTIDDMANKFGIPSASNKIPFFTAAQYLDYSDDLRIVRAIGSTALNATNRILHGVTATIDLTSVSGTLSPGDPITILETSKKATVKSYNAITGELVYIFEDGQFSEGQTVKSVKGFSGEITEVGTSTYKIKVSDSSEFEIGEVITGVTSSAIGTIIAKSDDYLIYTPSTGIFVISETIEGTDSSATGIVESAPEIITYSTGGILIKNYDEFDGMVVPFTFVARYPGELGNSILVSIANSATFESWVYKDLFDGAPAVNELHLVIIDTNGVFNNSYNGKVLKKYSYLNYVDINSKDESGQSDYYKKIINNQDSYIYAGDTTVTDLDFLLSSVMIGASNGTITDSDLISAYQKFSNAELETAFYLFGSNYSTAVTNAIISVIVQRGDIQGCFSPNTLSILQGSDESIISEAVVSWGDTITFDNHVILDSNWMFVYNKFNDEYIWVPMCGATAGINSRCDTINNVWDSPMGFTRGVYLNVTKIAWNPDKNSRKTIYARSINPIYISNQAGTVLMGDRTHIIKQSYLRQIAVRKTITLIERSAIQFLYFYLGQNNNSQTRMLCRSKLEQFLRQLGSQGAFRMAQVVCDESNNTQQVIDDQEMRVLIRILPQSSINWIELTVAVVNNTAVFTENVIQGIF